MEEIEENLVYHVRYNSCIFLKNTRCFGCVFNLRKIISF